MKKFIETMAALVVAFVLVGTMVGCGQTAPDQGEVDTTEKTPEDMEKEMKAMADKSKEDTKGAKGTPPGGTPPGGTPKGAPAPGGGAAPTPAPPSK